MGKLYTLTEENCKEVLNRLQRICNNWYLLNKQELFEVEQRTKKENYPISQRIGEVKSWGWIRRFNGFDNKGYCLSYNEFISQSSFIHAISHWSPDSYDVELWNGYKPLIYLDIKPYTGLFITIGDKVQFEKWGFIVYTRDISKINYIHKETYIIDRTRGRISDLNNEILKRDEEWRLGETAWLDDDNKIDD